MNSKQSYFVYVLPASKIAIMNILNHLNIKGFLLTALVLFTFVGNAQNVTGTKDICANYAYPIDLGEDVVGLALSAGGGTWYKVSSATGFDTELVSANVVSNIFLAIDRQPGAYYFVFVPKNNPCLDDSDRAIATVNIREIPIPISHTIALCDGETMSFDLSSLVSPTLKDMYQNMLYKDKDGKTLSTSSVSIGANDSGEMIYTYHLGSNASTCSDSARIVLNVLRDGIAPGFQRDSIIAFCLNSVPDKLNLIKEFELSVTGGSWSALGSAPVPNNGVIDLSKVSAPADFQYRYAYSGGNCASAGADTLTIKITDNLQPWFKDVSRDICKATSPSGYIDLMGLLGVSVPNSAGIWTEEEATSPVDVGDGIFELADSRTGKYVYKFSVSNSATDLCGLAGESAMVTLNLFDNGEVLDGEVQLCSSSLSGSIALSEFIPNLPNGGTWDGGTISVSNGEVLAADLKQGVNKFNYEFNGGPCGSGNALLYVTVTDEITSFTDKTIAYCLTDDGADAIDLDQVLGVFGISGSWSLDVAGSTSDQTGTGNWNANENVFNGRAAANAESAGEGTYVFIYTANADGCNISSGDKVKVTIEITKDLSK